MSGFTILPWLLFQADGRSSEPTTPSIREEPPEYHDAKYRSEKEARYLSEQIKNLQEERYVTTGFVIVGILDILFCQWPLLYARCMMWVSLKLLPCVPCSYQTNVESLVM